MATTYLDPETHTLSWVGAQGGLFLENFTGGA